MTDLRIQFLSRHGVFRLMLVYWCHHKAFERIYFHRVYYRRATRTRFKVSFEFTWICTSQSAFRSPRHVFMTSSHPGMSEALLLTSPPRRNRSVCRQIPAKLFTSPGASVRLQRTVRDFNRKSELFNRGKSNFDTIFAALKLICCHQYFCLQCSFTFNRFLSFYMLFLYRFLGIGSTLSLLLHSWFLRLLRFSLMVH